jgi:hypothetical protein
MEGEEDIEEFEEGKVTSYELPTELKEMLVNFFASRRIGVTRISPLLQWILDRQDSDPTFNIKEWLNSLGYTEETEYLRLMKALDRYKRLKIKSEFIKERLIPVEKKTLAKRVVSKTTELADLKFQVADKFIDEIIPMATQLGYELSPSGILEFCRFLKTFYEENREKVEMFDDAIALIKVLSSIVNPYFIRIMGQKVLSDTVIKLAELRANGLKVPYEYENYVLELLKNKIYDIIHESEVKLVGRGE